MRPRLEVEVSGGRYPESFMKSCYADTPSLEQYRDGGAGSDGSGGDGKPTRTADIIGGS